MKCKTVMLCLIALAWITSTTVLGQNKLYRNEFPLSDIKLLDGPFKRSLDLNIDVLLKYDTDRLLAPYRKEAGLEPKAQSYPNWDGLDGHVGGHYLSALAISYASTGNPECKRRMDYMLAELKNCQDANAIHNADWGKGYVGGVPNSKNIWPAFKKGDFSIFRTAWVPYYNLHKMYAGLRDAWLYCGNEEALDMFLKFCDWGIDIVTNLNDEQMQNILGIEHGGMNEVFADAFQITGHDKYLTAARRYSHKELLEPASRGTDNLDNKHANTQVPKFIGFSRIAELSNDVTYKKAGEFFWETVTTHRSLAFGGNSRREHFPSKTSCIDFINDVDGPESCNSYNMLKLTEDLFRMNALAKYADYYERTVFNHILSTQHPSHGGYVYFTPARPRHYRVYSAPNEAMWCCVGTGMENHGKYNQFIYTHSNDSLFLNLFIASELNWSDRKIKIRQETNFPFEERTVLKIEEGSARFPLMIRYPSWVKKGLLIIMINGKPFTHDAGPSSYICIDRIWNKGDIIELGLPMHSSIERLPNVPDYIAFMHGPIMLATKTGTEDLKGIIADDGRWSQYAAGTKLPVDQAPVIIDDNINNLASKLEAVKDQPLHFRLNVQLVNPIEIRLEPFNQIHDSRYMMYWLALTNSGYQAYLDSLSGIEKEKIALEKRTIDFVAPGEQQPEADHALQKENSTTGNTNDEFYRDAHDEGYFSYKFSTRREKELSLIVRYWGAEWGNRKFEIYIDDEKLLTVDNTGKWNQSLFQQEEYPITTAMLEGKDFIRVKFQALPGNTAGGVYYIRLAKKDAGMAEKPAPKPSYQKTGTGIKAIVNDLQTEIKFYNPSLIRISKWPVGKNFTKESLSVIMEPQKTTFSVKQQGNQIVLKTEKLQILFNLTNGNIAYADAKGKPMLQEKESGASLTPFNDAGVNSYSVSQEFFLDKDEAIYGLGQQQQGKMIQRNLKLNMIQGNTDDYIPFFQSVKGYGLFWDNYSPTVFEDTPESTLFRSETGNGIDYYFMAGGNADGVIAQMRELTGRVPMFPLWTYGYWQSKERYKSQDELVGVVKKYRELGVPLDGIIQDWQYWGNNYLWNAMEFLNPEFYDPVKMIRDVHNLNAHIIISIWNSFGPQTKPYKELDKSGALLDFKTWPESGSEKWPPNPDYPSGVRVYDAFNPAARDIFWKYLHDGIYTTGMDGWWMDSSEPDHMQFKSSDLDQKTYLGSFRSVRNAFPLMTVGGVAQHQRALSADKRVFILTRSAFAGQQRYGANTWSGDVVASWEALRNQISAGLNFSLCGIPHWNSDIGGFFLWNFKEKLLDAEYRELYARWIQFGTFCPMMRSHGEGAPREIYQFGKKGEKVYDAIEKYIHLRYRLLPYIYSASWDVTANHSSMMRALAMDFACDKKALDLNDEYMFGKSLLICPVTQALYSKDLKEDFSTIRSRELYLPEGTSWIDFWTGEKLTGGQTVKKETPLDIIPVYVKAGTVLPFGPEVQYATEKKWDDLEIRVYEGADGRFTLYEDENDNYNYEKGAFSTILFTWNNTARMLTIHDRNGNFPGMIESRAFKIVLVGKGNGTGLETTAQFDQRVFYSGRKISIKLK